MTASGAKTQLRTLPTHGALELPSVHVDTYNCELEDEDGFVGDKASKAAFRNILNRVRKALRTSGEDPLGKKHSKDIPKGTSKNSTGVPRANQIHVSRHRQRGGKRWDSRAFSISTSVSRRSVPRVIRSRHSRQSFPSRVSAPRSRQ